MDLLSKEWGHFLACFELLQEEKKKKTQPPKTRKQGLLLYFVLSCFSKGKQLFLR